MQAPAPDRQQRLPAIALILAASFAVSARADLSATVRTEPSPLVAASPGLIVVRIEHDAASGSFAFTSPGLDLPDVPELGLSAESPIVSEQTVSSSGPHGTTITVQLGVRVVPPQAGTYVLPAIEVILGDPTRPTATRTKPLEVVVSPPLAPAERLGGEHLASDAPSPRPKSARVVGALLALLLLAVLAVVVLTVVARRRRVAEPETSAPGPDRRTSLAAAVSDPDGLLYREGVAALRGLLSRAGDSEALTSAELLDRAGEAGLGARGRGELERFLEAADEVRYGGAVPDLATRNQDFARIIYVLGELEHRAPTRSAADSP